MLLKKLSVTAVLVVNISHSSMAVDWGIIEQNVLLHVSNLHKVFFFESGTSCSGVLDYEYTRHCD